MRFVEIIPESLRSTRQKDFPAKLNKNYTIGFELELHVDDDYIYEFEMSDEEIFENAPYDSEVLLEYLFYKFNFNLSNDTFRGVADFLISIKDNFEMRDDVYTKDEYIKKVNDEVFTQKENESKVDYLIRLFEFHKNGPIGISFDRIKNSEKLLNKNIENIKNKIKEKFVDIPKDDLINFNTNKRLSRIFTSVMGSDKILDRFSNDFFDMEPFIEKNKDKIIKFFQKNFNISHYKRENIDPPNSFDYTEHTFKNILNIDIIVPDESVMDGVEIITKVYDDFNEAINDLGKALEFVSNSPYFSTSNETGLHVNIGTFSNEEIQKIDLFKFLTVLNEDFVLNDFNRLNNHFAKSQTQGLRKAIKEYVENLKDYDKLKYKLNNSLFSMAQKFDVVNLSKLKDDGYVEFRGMGGNYDDKFDKIKTNIKKYIRAFEIAGDPNAYRKEYIKVLSKIVPNQNEDKALSPLQKVFIDGGIKDIRRFNLSSPSDFVPLLTRLITWNDTEELMEYMKYESGSHKDLIGRINKSLTSEMYKNFKSPNLSPSENERAQNLKDILDLIDAKEYVPKLYKLISMLP